MAATLMPPRPAAAQRVRGRMLCHPGAGTWCAPSALWQPPRRGSRLWDGTQHGLMEHGLMEHGLMEHGLMEHGLMEHGLMEHGLMEHGTGALRAQHRQTFQARSTTERPESETGGLPPSLEPALWTTHVDTGPAPASAAAASEERAAPLQLGIAVDPSRLPDFVPRPAPTIEEVWAQPLGPERFRLLSAPLYALAYTLWDQVHALPHLEWGWLVRTKLASSPLWSLPVRFRDLLAARHPTVRQALASLEAQREFGRDGYCCIAVPHPHRLALLERLRDWHVAGLVTAYDPVP